MKIIVHPYHLAMGHMKIPHLIHKAKEAKQPVQDFAIGYTAVATVGYANDWAAYWLEAGEDPQRVITNGDKIDRDLAEGMFPWFKQAGLEYRP